jgi:hypothetical protein
VLSHRISGPGHFASSTGVSLGPAVRPPLRIGPGERGSCEDGKWGGEEWAASV